MVDFDSSRRNVVFNRRSTTEFFNVPIINDDISEPLENFSIAIEIPPQFSDIGVLLGDPAVATGFIIDNDGMSNINHICICIQITFVKMRNLGEEKVD